MVLSVDVGIRNTYGSLYILIQIFCSILVHCIFRKNLTKLSVVAYVIVLLVSINSLGISYLLGIEYCVDVH